MSRPPVACKFIDGCGVAQVARVQLQDALAALAAEQADSKHLRDKLKMAQVLHVFVMLVISV